MADVQVRRRLAQLLEARGYGAQADLARDLGEHRNRVNNWVRGTTDIKADDVPRIADALQITICDLYGTQDQHQPAPVAAALAERVAEATGAPVERIEVNVYLEASGKLDPGELPAIRAALGSKTDTEPEPDVILTDLATGRIYVMQAKSTAGPGRAASGSFRELGLLRSYVRDWAALDEDERRELLDLADEIRRFEKGDGDGD